ncbi:MAG: ABC transporter ATP-binding protein/permease [Lachnospiraceae bacterium]|nr:ABC transporter ATP-binding protein/permease [Lachnospiraceae bacterium]
MVKKLASYIKEYKAPSIATPICMIFEVLFEILIPMLMASIVNDGINKGDMGHIYRTGALMVLFAICGLVSGILGGVFAAKAATGFAKNLRKALFDRVQEFSFHNIDHFSTAGLVTRLTTDVTNIQNSYQVLLRMCFRAPFSMIMAMVAAFIISPKIASIYLIAVVFLSIILLTIMRSAMKYFTQVFKKYDELNATVQENVNAIRVVKAYVREEYEKSRMKKAVENIFRMFVKAESRIVLNWPVMQLTVYTCILTISWFGAQIIVNSLGTTLETGDLMSLLAYCMNILMSLMMISMIFVMSSMAIASAERICEVLNEEPDIKDPEDPVKKVKDGSIEFSDVDFSYDREGNGDPVLKDVTLSIKSGETIGIIGGTGSAKTSLVNLISRLYDVSRGSVKLGGVDVRDYEVALLRDEVSVVLQKNVLFSGTILDNLRWGKEDATEEECREACRLACADEFIEKMPEKYETHIEQGGTNVSGGQKQRLCIARALLKKPKVLILDDSTSAVDTATDAKIRKAFREAIPGTTKLIIAQRISSVMDADRIIVMEEGRVNGFGTHEELLQSNEIYREVYESQTGGNGDFDEPH